MKASYAGAIVVFPTILAPLPWHIACIAFTMIVCSCNVLSDHDIRSVMSAADELPRTTHQVYGCLGCRVECGRCVGTIRKIMGHGCDNECLSMVHSEDRCSERASAMEELAL